MNITMDEAIDCLEALINRAESGEEIVLTRRGRAMVRISPVRGTPTPEQRAWALDRAMAEADRVREPGPSSAELQDSLYDENGLPA